jgi:TRAP-type C4-dicarboxylate transport system permease small subunit
MADKVNKGNFIGGILHSQKRWRIAVAIGAVILVIGISGTLYFGSINVAQVVKNNVNPQTGLPNTVNGVPPAQAQLIFEILIFIGLFILAYGIGTQYTRLSNKMRQ